MPDSLVYVVMEILRSLQEGPVSIPWHFDQVSGAREEFSCGRHALIAFVASEPLNPVRSFPTISTAAGCCEAR